MSSLSSIWIGSTNILLFLWKFEISEKEVKRVNESMRWYALWNWKLVRSGFFVYSDTFFLLLLNWNNQCHSLISNESFYIESWMPRRHIRIFLKREWNERKKKHTSRNRYNSHNRRQQSNYWFHSVDPFSCHSWLWTFRTRFGFWVGSNGTNKRNCLILNSLTLSRNGIFQQQWKYTQIKFTVHKAPHKTP